MEEVVRNPASLRLEIACACLLASAFSARGQQTAPAIPPSTEPKLNCRHPADPLRDLPTERRTC
jgi:hypothetical protein